eukprot:Opistho-1_new@10836
MMKGSLDPATVYRKTLRRLTRLGKGWRVRGDKHSHAGADGDDESVPSAPNLSQDAPRATPPAHFVEPAPLDDLQLSVRAPGWCTREEWLALNTIDFYNQINLLYAAISPHCTDATCPVMSAGPNFEYYLREDKGAGGGAFQVSAPVYTEQLMAWVASQLIDTAVMPPAGDTRPFPDRFVPVVQSIFRRLFCVYAHIHCAHLSHLEAIGLSDAFGVRCRHFLYFVFEFDLIQRRQLAPMWSLVATVLDLRDRMNSGGLSGLDPDARLEYQRRALDAWLERRGMGGKEKKLSVGAAPINLARTQVFGASLTSIIDRERFLEGSRRTVPRIVEQCVEFLGEPAYIQKEGLFRVSGSVGRIQKLRQCFDTDPDSVDLHSDDWCFAVHCVASVLKLFFRELPDPLLTSELYDKWIDIGKIEDNDARLAAIRPLLEHIPPYNRATLKYMAEFLCRVARHSETNRMSVDNLAIVFGPVFLWPRDRIGESMRTNSQSQARLVVSLITDPPRVFGDAPAQ